MGEDNLPAKTEGVADVAEVCEGYLAAKRRYIDTVTEGIL